MSYIFALIFVVSAVANAKDQAEQKKVPFTNSDFYEDNLGCFPASSFKPAGYGNGFWITEGQGTNGGEHGSREIKIVPLNKEVASALQATAKKRNSYLCLGGSSLGGPYDGKGPNVVYPFSAKWK